MSAQSLGRGPPGAAARLPVVGAPLSAIGAVTRALGGHHARPRTRSSGRNVTCSPALVRTWAVGGCPSLQGCGTQGPVAAGIGQGRWQSRAAPSLGLPPTTCALPPECPPGQVFRACATSCPRLCSHLWPGSLCAPEPCWPGCGCPGERVGAGAVPGLPHGWGGVGRARGRGPSVTGTHAALAAARWHVCAPGRVSLCPALSALGPHLDPCGAGPGAALRHCAHPELHPLVRAMVGLGWGRVEEGMEASEHVLLSSQCLPRWSLQLLAPR